MADYHLNQQIAEQSKAMLAGMHAVVPAGWLRLFNRPELMRLIGGDDVPMDVADLRKHTKCVGGRRHEPSPAGPTPLFALTPHAPRPLVPPNSLWPLTSCGPRHALCANRYVGGYHELSPMIRDFWSVLHDFDREERALFLKFVSSCSRPPLLGFAHMHPAFTIQCVTSDGNEVPSVLAFLGMGRKETSRLPTASTCFNLLKLPNVCSPPSPTLRLSPRHRCALAASFRPPWRRSPPSLRACALAADLLALPAGRCH